jgi:uncharacterized 2Fe-2S/4Fe-4S cluster protein (DUF4445 family)
MTGETMTSQTVNVTFQPEGKTVAVPARATIRQAAAEAGIDIDFPCGAQGGCGKCRVRVEPASPPNDFEVMLLPPTDINDGIRLACQTRLDASVTVDVPEESRLAPLYKILQSGADSLQRPTDPPVVKKHFQLSTPTLEDDAPDLERIRQQLGNVEISLELVRQLPTQLRDSGFSGTAVISNNWLIDVEPGDTTSQCPVAAFDIGTTTLVGTLCDAKTGELLARTARMNPQTSFGDDVLSRIQHAGESAEGLERLQRDVTGAVNEMLDELTGAAACDRDRVYAVTFAGNSTMQHLLAGVDPSPLGVMPFVPVLGGPLDLAARDIGVNIHPRARAYVFPLIGGFVGGDTVAGILTSGLTRAEKPTMFVDIGTNGEIVVCANDRMVATSCAAGPAFEGARISHGMRAAAGAIEEVQFGDDITIKIIGDARPIGLCGSALIDLAAGLLRCGALMPEGMLLNAELAPPETPQAIRDRLIDTEQGPAFLIVPAEGTQTGRPILLLQKDIRELQLATGAVRSGVLIMLKAMQLDIGDLDCVLVAGAFGNYIRCENAQRIGLLPSDYDPDRIRFVGNTSLAGAQQAALSRAARDRARDIAAQTEHVDLSTDPAFQEIYVEAMFFPREETVAG